MALRAFVVVNWLILQQTAICNMFIVGNTVKEVRAIIGINTFEIYNDENEFMLVQVKFKQNGVKWLSWQYANLILY